MHVDSTPFFLFSFRSNEGPTFAIKNGCGVSTGMQMRRTAQNKNVATEKEREREREKEKKGGIKRE